MIQKTKHYYLKVYARCLFCVFPLVWITATGAETSEVDIVESLTPFPRSTIIEQLDSNVADYSIALGEMKKIRGLWAPERELRKEGGLERTTSQAPNGHSPQEVFAYYQRKMRSLNARVLFSCEARNCGSSNAWANEQFKVKQLYGQDRQQSFAAYEILDDQSRLHYITIYTVIRGNKRVYAHTEWLQTQGGLTDSAAPSTAEIDAYFHNPGFYVVSGVKLEGGKLLLNDEHLLAIVNAIQTNRRMVFQVVGHDYRTGANDEQIDRSKIFAQQFVEMLVAGGIAENRLNSHGVGGLAPAGRSVNSATASWRIELVAATP